MNQNKPSIVVRREAPYPASFLSCLRLYKGIQGLDNCIETDIEAAAITNQACGKCHTTATNMAATALRASDHRLSLERRNGSACRHQRISRNSVPKTAM